MADLENLVFRDQSSHRWHGAVRLPGEATSKPVIATGQTYFAIQTRRQELADDEQFARLSENEKRLAIRNELAQHNKYLAAAAQEKGVETSLDYAIFQDHGYRGLYGGQGYSCPQEVKEKPEDSGVGYKFENRE